jgi:hypothetical protein
MPDLDKTKNHFHQDPKLIEQINCSTTLMIGQIVYQDHDGVYKPAQAITRHTCNVQGVVWSFIGQNKFYLKTEPGPMYYKFPFIPDWFVKDVYNHVYENAIIYKNIPGAIGEKVYLSHTIPGGMMADPFKTKTIYDYYVDVLGFNPKYSVLIGYRTDYGLLYRPEPYCLINTDFEDTE